MNSQRWVIYALGGGYGHFTRALSLAQAATRLKQSVEIIFNSGLAAAIPKETIRQNPKIHLKPIPAEFDKAQIRSILADRLIEDPNFDVFCVDTFARGLGGELVELLPQIRSKKILIHRDLNPRYVEEYNLEEVLPHYELILVPGESAAFDTHERAFKTPPWLVCDPESLLPRELARETLGVDVNDRRPVVAFMSTGTRAEMASSLRYAEQTQHKFPNLFVRNLNLDPSTINHPLVHASWPAFRLLRGVDLLICSGGYNTVQEARAANTWFLGFAQKRLYDQQEKRLSPHERVQSLDEVFKACAELEAHGFHHHTAPIAFENGAIAAALRVNELVAYSAKTAPA
jgi:hypothetical protein